MMESEGIERMRRGKKHMERQEVFIFEIISLKGNLSIFNKEEILRIELHGLADGMWKSIQ